jgi:hypothetical protein
VPTRVSPTDALRAEIHDLFGSGRDIAEVLEEVMRLSARMVLQQVLETRSPPGWAATGTPAPAASAPGSATATAT